MKSQIVKLLKKEVPLSEEQLANLIEVPPSSELGDFAFPCFSLAKQLKKAPQQIALDLSKKISSKELEKVEAKGPYLNFFLKRDSIVLETINKIQKQKEKYGSAVKNKKTIVIDMSSPNIAKPFGIGHLRSTIIGESLSRICYFMGYKTIKVNYLGDWGTQFGKLIVGYKKYGSASKLKKDPINHLLELYVKVSNNPDLEQESRDWFRKLESGDKEALKLWKLFRKLSLEDFSRIYALLNVKFDVISGESLYNNKMDSTIKELESKNLLKESEGAKVVDLEKYGLGICLIKKSDGATLYATRDLTATLDRYKKYKFERMIYEVGSEQKLHFNQVFKVLELLGHSWAKNCIHVDHGLYLGKDGKKLATRKGTNFFMSDILDETISLAKKEIAKREKLSNSELDKRAKQIALAAIIYGDLKNYRTNDITFDIDRFLEFEGNTGPYLLYTYARARSILRKAKYKYSPNIKTSKIEDREKQLVLELNKFPEVVLHSYNQLSPNLIANYAYGVSQKFNEFYHSEKVIGSENERFKLVLVDSFSKVLKNALFLLGISTIEKM